VFAGGRTDYVSGSRRWPNKKQKTKKKGGGRISERAQIINWKNVHIHRLAHRKQSGRSDSRYAIFSKGTIMKDPLQPRLRPTS